MLIGRENGFEIVRALGNDRGERHFIPEKTIEQKKVTTTITTIENESST